MFRALSLEERVPQDDLLRPIRTMVDVVLKELSPQCDALYSHTARPSAIDGRTTRHSGYAVSQRKRNCVEEIFGSMKTVGLLRKTRRRGVARG